MKLALGTAQFGLDYGVANKQGRVSLDEVRSILAVAKSAGIRTLDTAAAYGNSEATLGMAGIDRFEVITKIPPFPSDALSDIGGWIRKTVTESLSGLNIESLTGLLLHRPLELLSEVGDETYQTLTALKKQGIVEKIGISIYQPQDLDALIPRFDFDIIQAPLNILDRRLISSGWLQKLKHNGVEVHTRSAFLQGLLLMKPEERPAYFSSWTQLLNRLDQWWESQGLTAAQACLGFLYQLEDIDRIIVGTDSAQQLQQIINIDLQVELAVPSYLESDDEALINPARWTL